MRKAWVQSMKRSRKGKPFQHPASVPVPFALSVYRIMHNQASAADWEEIDKVSRTQALRYIHQILVANETPHLGDEMDWWGVELYRNLGN